MKSNRLFQLVGLLILVLGSAQAHGQVVRYRNANSRELWTVAQVDTFKQLMNRRGRTAGLEFNVLVSKAIARPDTIIYEYTLMGTHTAAALQARLQSLDGFIGQPLPDFALPDFQGKLLSAQSLRGKPVVLNLWFTTCGPCIAEMPTLNRIRQEKAHAGTVFLAMTFDSREKVQAFLRKQPFDFQHLTDAKQYCNQFQTGYPITIFVDKNGIIKKVLGSIPVELDAVTHKEISADDKEFYAALKQIEQG